MGRGRILAVVVGVVMATGVLAPAADAASNGDAADEAIASSGVLVPGDLPASYTESSRSEADAKTEKLAAKLTPCKRLVTFRKAIGSFPKAKSDSFDQGQTQLDNQVTVFPSEAKAKAAVTAYSSSDLPKCFSQLLSTLARQAGGTAKANITKRQDATEGYQALAYEGPVKLTESDGSTSTVAFGTIAIRIGRGVAVYTYQHDAQVDFSDDLNHAIESSGTRLEDALSA